MFIALVFACLTFSCCSSSEIDENENSGSCFSYFLASIGCNPPQSYCCCCCKCVSEEEYLRQMGIEPKTPKPQVMGPEKKVTLTKLGPEPTTTQHDEVHQIFVESSNITD